MSKKKRAMTTGLVVLFLAFVLLVPVRQEPYVAYEQHPITTYVDVQEPYSVTEYYTVQEPYTVTEDVWVEKSSTITSPLTYIAVRGSSSSHTFDSSLPGFYAWIYLQNTDSEGGFFQVDFDLKLLGGGWAKESAVVYIPSGAQKKVEVSHIGCYLDSFDWDVKAPLKTTEVYTSVCEKQEVIKYRDVQVSRQVTKYRIVSKERTDWKTLQVIRYRQVSIVGIGW